MKNLLTCVVFLLIIASFISSRQQKQRIKELQTKIDSLSRPILFEMNRHGEAIAIQISRVDSSYIPILYDTIVWRDNTESYISSGTPAK